ncbi:MAG TPA: ABC transporter substrate-binding protein [Rhodothermales bacterium]|nr:ABC transporter substrate-binding protein [Rhodothermales bacterium]
MTCRTIVAICFLALLAGCSNSISSDRETTTLRIAQQFGIGYLPLQMMREHSLIEQHAKQQGIELTTAWLRFSDGAAMNDALLNHDLDIASGGIAPLLTAWDQTLGAHGVRGVACLNEMPLYLNTNQADIQSLHDFDEDDRIALPAVAVSIQARTLQMAAEQAGLAFDTLDDITVSMPHTDGVAALTVGDAEITGHLTSPPFMYQELQNEDPQIHRILSSYDVLGGPSTFNCVWAASHFREENPAVYRVFLGALEEAIEMIAADKEAAADVYVKQAESELEPTFILGILNDSEITFTMTPANTMQYAAFMHKVGALSNKPETWQDYFFAEIHHLGGS